MTQRPEIEHQNAYLHMNIAFPHFFFEISKCDWHYQELSFGVVNVLHEARYAIKRENSGGAV